MARLAWAPHLCTAGGIMHGGVLMSLADSAGALVTFLGLPEGATTATITSTSQLFRPVTGGTVRAVAIPLHRGRTTVTAQTSLYDSEDRLVAQTHAGPGGQARRSVAMTGVVGPGAGHARYARGSVMYFKALAEQDDGDLSLMERTLPPGGRRPAHRHTNCSEAYFVLDGLVSVTVEDEELRVGPQGFVLVPRGTAHCSATRATARPGSW